MTRNEANISIEPYIKQISRHNKQIWHKYMKAIENKCEKYYWKVHDLKDARTGATCLEFLF